MARNSKKRFPKGSVCKPCWELRYCPFGPLVEQFPLQVPEAGLPDLRALLQATIENLGSGQLRNEAEIRDEVDRLLYLDPTKWALLEKFDSAELECRIWGHWCPVFWTQSAATETKVARRQGRNFPRDIMLKVVRRDSQICQSCFKYVPDNEVEFDHVIPLSRGGPTAVENLRLLCRRCNRKKSNKSSEVME